MKYIKTSAITMIGATLALLACGKTTKEPQEEVTPSLAPLQFEKTEVKIQPEEEAQLKLIAMPEGEVKVQWSSSKPEIATVDAQGKVVPKSFGVTEIKATLGSNTAICKVVVGLGPSPFDLNEKICLQYVWDYKKYKNITYKGDKPAIIDFWATWCAPCITMNPSLKQLATEYEGKAYIFKADLSVDDVSPGEPIVKAIGDAGNDPGIYQPPAGTLSLPSFLLLPADGSAPKAVIGPDLEALRSFLKSEVAKEKQK